MARQIFTLILAVELDVPDGEKPEYVDHLLDKALDSAFDSGYLDYEHTIEVKEHRWEHDSRGNDPAKLKEMGFISLNYPAK